MNTLLYSPKGTAFRAPYEVSLQAGAIAGAAWDGNRRVRWGGPDLAGPIASLLAATGQQFQLQLRDGGTWPPAVPEPAVLPAALEAYPLRAYQREGIGRALLSSVLLAFDMGLGKSLAAILAAQLNRGPTLIVAPGIVRSIWAGTASQAGELRKWLGSGIDLRILSGRTDGKIDASLLANVTPATWVVCNYEILDYHDQKKRRAKRLSAAEAFAEESEPRGKAALQQSPWLPLLAAIPWRTIILDEIHYIKKRNSKRTAALTEIRKAVPDALRIGLTGTPLHNHPRDLWSILEWLQPGKFGTYWQFANRYAAAHENDLGFWDDKGISNADELRYRLQWYMVRKTKAEVAHLLPPKTRQIVPLSPSEKDARALDNAIRELYLTATLAGRKPSHFEVAAVLHGYGGAKVTTLLELVANRSGRVVVFAGRRDTAKTIYEKLQAANISVFGISGELPQAKRNVQIDGFRASEAGVLVATMGVAGLGLDLSAAATAIFVDLDPVPGVLLQCEDRLWRPPQAVNVTVYYLVLRGTLDESIAHLVVSKLDAYQQVFGSEAEAVGLQNTLGAVSNLDNEEAAISALAKMLEAEAA